MNINIRALVTQIAFMFLVYALPLFLPAGILAWPAAWIFLALWFGFLLCLMAWLFRHNPGLFQERMRFGASDQRGWDKMLFPLIYVALFVWLLFMSFDVVRFHWSPVPVWLQVIGAMILLCSFYILFLTFRENSYLSPVARIQQEREQTVISTGPYHWVRHPMYAAMIVFVVGTPLLLGAWYGVLVGLIFVLVLAARAVLEERTLQQELPNYATYMSQVKYRLIPYVW